MCVKLKGSKMSPGQVHAFLTRLGKASGTWGLRSGAHYNIRSESMNKVWREISMNRGILSVDSFWEKDKQFVHKDGLLLNIGILYNNESEFAVLTSSAEGIVKPYHHRMPLLVEADYIEDFLNSTMIIELPPENLKLVA